MDEQADRMPELKQLVAEASQALAHLDADRLEELALCCQALNGGLEELDGSQRARLVCQASLAAGEMATLARVLEATRANLHVMRRLRELHTNRLEYGPALVQSCVDARSERGND